MMEDLRYTLGRALSKIVPRRTQPVVSRQVSDVPSYSSCFNTPIKVCSAEWYANERLVEVPFVHRHLPVSNGYDIRALEFGCSRSHLALEMSALGFDVVGIDLRNYELESPPFTFVRGNILDYEDQRGFDVVCAVSVLEHIGLGVYGERAVSDDRAKVAAKLYDLLRPQGTLLVTVPCGKPTVDEFLQVFDPCEVTDTFSFENLVLEEMQFFRRHSLREWRPCSCEEARGVSSDPSVRGPTGVNCVGCFKWRKRT
ncbi:MAG: class I SAM-dependent methyltransferase [Candidatus Paceibacterota bacterium]